MRPQNGPEAKVAILPTWRCEVVAQERSRTYPRTIVRDSIHLRPSLSIRIPKLCIKLIKPFAANLLQDSYFLRFAGFPNLHG